MRGIGINIKTTTEMVMRLSEFQGVGLQQKNCSEAMRSVAAAEFVKLIFIRMFCQGHKHFLPMLSMVLTFRCNSN